MPTLEDLAERVERLLLRHQELRRANALLEQQVQTLGRERSRIDTLLDRLPADAPAAVPEHDEGAAR